MSTGTGFGYNYETKKKPSLEDILTVMMDLAVTGLVTGDAKCSLRTTN